jgi:mono/diheme cytochrome c family protein
MEKSKELYNIYCAICHGEKGNGKGYLVEREKILGVPSYADRTVTVGSIYHVLTYGLNSMGAYSNQLNQKERWMVSQYVLKLKSEL